MSKLPEEYPRMQFRAAQSETSSGLYMTILALFNNFIKQRRQVAEVVNANAVTFYNQAAAPTLVNGQLAAWKDSDATTGNPTHYLVYKDDNGTQVTFASEETVP